MAAALGASVTKVSHSAPTRLKLGAMFSAFGAPRLDFYRFFVRTLLTESVVIETQSHLEWRHRGLYRF